MKSQGINLLYAPSSPTGIQAGKRGHLLSERNQITAIGEDHLYLWVILENTGEYYGILKHPANLAAAVWSDQVQPDQQRSS